MLEISHLRCGYAGKNVLQDVNLTIPAEKVTAILGPNGCGKSTLLRAICGILPISGGEILFKGEPLLSLPPKLLARKTAYLAQSRRVPDITVRRLVLHGRFPYLGYPRRYREADLAAARRALEAVGIAPLAHRDMAALSGGERQKAYIALALAQDAKLLLLDEPDTYLDIRHRLQLMRLARTLCAEGRTVLMVTHELETSLRFADRVCLMDGGAIAQQAAPEDVDASLLGRIFGVKAARENGQWRFAEA